jgi:tRNA G18 (ribose-2'-O)-methylase SpoU
MKSDPEPHRSFLILFNVAKRSNFGFMIRSANAFGTEPVIIGKSRYNTVGAVGGTRRTPVHHFYTLPEGIEFVRSQGCRIYGIEIMPNARSIADEPFSGPTAFMVGNEGAGLVPAQTKWCDDFLYIPQYGSAVSLNVSVATGIVLHRFAEWAGRTECPRGGFRFLSEDTPETMHEKHQQHASVVESNHEVAD